jgi:2-C-methyl-D-erythritol 2,4-cyclodiphosphate synthase
MSIRIGQGIDFHQMVEGRPFWLGGIEIPHYKGALGHSDADVLLHALSDALLGAIGAGDIGVHFPDTASENKDIDSKIILKHAVNLIYQQGYRVVNVDCTILVEKPKIRPYVGAMQSCIADILGVDTVDVSIKATTTEKMSFVGREEGIVATAVALIQKK